MVRLSPSVSGLRWSKSPPMKTKSGSSAEALAKVGVDLCSFPTVEKSVRTTNLKSLDTPSGGELLKEEKAFPVMCYAHFELQLNHDGDHYQQESNTKFLQRAD